MFVETHWFPWWKKIILKENDRMLCNWYRCESWQAVKVRTKETHEPTIIEFCQIMTMLQAIEKSPTQLAMWKEAKW